MPRAILRNGSVCLVDPIPSEWMDGQELWVEEVLSGPSQCDRDLFQEFEALCATADPQEDARLQAALEERQREAKEFMRRRAGVP